MSFYKRLNDSPWQGVISEVGCGIPFCHDYLMNPGASKTILACHSDYGGLNQPIGMRSVSLENVKRMAANNMLEGSQRKQGDYKPVNNLFGLAYSFAHYEDRDSHGWVYLKTLNIDAYMHFSIKANDSRSFVANVLSQTIQWFVEGFLLTPRSWNSHIRMFPFTLESNHIDVLYGPGVSDVERLSLLKKGTLLAYSNGEFVRVVDLLREDKPIYAGSFNPPHDGHAEIGENAIFELSQHNCYKGYISAEDMLHRMRMIDLAGYPVILSQVPLFVDKHAILNSYHPREYIYRMGVDSWNRFIAIDQYPVHDYLEPRLQNSKFEVYGREGEMMGSNILTKKLNATFIESSRAASSTEVRDGNLNYVDPKVKKYIIDNGLYELSCEKLLTSQDR